MNATIEVSEPTENVVRDRVAELHACVSPLLIGVRHHSAAMARSIDTLLTQFQPERLLIEMPIDLQDWMQYLADDETQAPVAVSAVDARGNLAFYPLADFSPELVAIRWAVKHGTPVIACDLSVSATWSEDSSAEHCDPARNVGESCQVGREVIKDLLRRTQSNDTGQLWERLVESPAILSDAETVRRMGLTFGWATRISSEELPLRDQYREAMMRDTIRRSPGRTAAVVGAFHASALLPTVVQREQENDAKLLGQLTIASETVGVSLVPYSFEQLDERSGYPAGIRDPVWHQQMVQAGSPSAISEAASELIVQICRQMRKRGHVAGTPDATEVIRMSRDLARLRRLPAPGRGEFIESIESCLVQGEMHGRAREVARAAQHVLIGTRHGNVTSRAPRGGLAVSLDELLKPLGLPTADNLGQESKEFRLDVLRSPRDRARAVVIRQMNIAGIPYAKRVDSIQQGQRENLVERYEVGWQAGTSATIESVARFGVMLPQAVEGVLRRSVTQLEGLTNHGDTLLPSVVAQQLELAAECGLHDRLSQWLDDLESTLVKTGGLAELVSVAALLGRIQAGHVLGLPREEADAYPPILRVFDHPFLSTRKLQLVRACLDRLEGIAGSDNPDDVAALGDLVQWFSNSTAIDEDTSLVSSGKQRLIGWCSDTLDQGSDRMRGASAGVLCQLEHRTSDDLAALMGGWFDAAIGDDSRQRLRRRLAGVVQVLLTMIQSDPVWLAGLESRLQQSSDTEFLRRLSALRGAFDATSPADRDRILESRLMMYSERGSTLSLAEWETLEGRDGTDRDSISKLTAAWREADLAGQLAVQSLMPDFEFALPELHGTKAEDNEAPSMASLSSDAIPIADRWRMILGVPPKVNSRANEIARSLDQLYGRGRGEGSRAGLGNRPSGKGGTEAPQPTTLQWADELELFFGADVCQEVLAESASKGNATALDRLDPDQVTPSVQLLQQVLSLAGGLGEGRAERLRTLAKRITEQLAKKLAVRLAPSLSGLSSPRPTRRRSRRLNLSRTIRDNLDNACRREDGRAGIVAERLIFNSQTRREMDWHLSFVVDVSGSMSTSVIYSALCAAIFAELPALSVRFYAFSTEVIDLTGKVADPLTLLLEVQVGGGTHIGLGLAAARAAVKVPSRSIVVLVSDFEEGVSLGQLLSEVQAMTLAGVKCVGLAAIDDSGTARFHQANATMVAAAGMPVAAVSPERLADWVGDQIRGQAGQAAKSPLGTLCS